MFCDTDYKDQLAQEELGHETTSPFVISHRRNKLHEFYNTEEAPSDVAMKTRAFLGTVALFGVAGAAVGSTTGNTLDGALYTGAFGVVAAAVAMFSERQNSQN